MDALTAIGSWIGDNAAAAAVIAGLLLVVTGAVMTMTLARMVRASERQAAESRRLLGSLAERFGRELEPNLVLVPKAEHLELVNLGKYPAYVNSIGKDVGGERHVKNVILYTSLPGNEHETISKVLPPSSSGRLSGLASGGFLQSGTNTFEILFLYGGSGAQRQRLVADVVLQSGKGITVTSQKLAPAGKS